MIDNQHRCANTNIYVSASSLLKGLRLSYTSVTASTPRAQILLFKGHSSVKEIMTC